jgi:serine/threonine protein phosphatase PrpC
VKEHKISEGDLLIFLTDGIYSRLTNSEVKFHIEKHINEEMDIILSLSKLANDRGNLDNQSGIVLQF